MTKYVDSDALMERFAREERACDEHGRDFTFSFKRNGVNCAEWWTVQQMLSDAPHVPIWHDVKLELPTKEKADYLCISYFSIDLPGFDEKLKWDVSIFRFYDGKFWWFSENEEYEQNDVVFWMEIPEYPMVVKDGKID